MNRRTATTQTMALRKRSSLQWSAARRVRRKETQE